MVAQEPKIFDLAHALEIFDGNRRILRTVIGNFLSDLPRDLDGLVQAAKRQDAPEVRHLAHRMAGAAGMIGAMRFMAWARKLEISSTGTLPDSAPDQARRLRDEFELFKKAVAEDGAHDGKP